MNRLLSLIALTLVILTTEVFAQTATRAEGLRVPAPLQPWETWATWNDEALLHSPTLFSNASAPLTFWPSELVLSADDQGLTFRQNVTVYSPSWVSLPQSVKLWPTTVTSSARSLAVLSRENVPSVFLLPGTHEITGHLAWNAMPQYISIPQETGIIRLEINGQAIPAPLWDASGRLWLKRDAAPEEATGPDSLTVNFYAILEDNIPLWFHANIELVVSGASREADLGTIVPQGWSVSSVNCPLPVAVDEAGHTRVQVRAGRWSLHVSAFMNRNIHEMRFAPEAQPASASMLLGFRANPTLRLAEILGASQVDVTMTTFPDDWRNLPVYQWNTATPLEIKERLRGTGEQTPEGLQITRALWLDENGGGLTFRDTIQGQRQKIWRLDIAPEQELGSVSSDHIGQLITRNPATGAPGVEIRSRDISLVATGRIPETTKLSASGWQTDANSLSSTLNLPSGWRLFALFGADWTKGDWLTSWSLLDIFLVLIFILAIYRMAGWSAALIAAIALILSFREPNAPQLWWLALLAPIAILRVVPAGRLRAVVNVWKWATVTAFIFVIVPFLAAQIQQAIYPQLDIRQKETRVDIPLSEASVLMDESATVAAAPPQRTRAKTAGTGSRQAPQPNKAVESAQNQNLLYDAKARIQTGPGIPNRLGQQIRFGWNGPVSESQQIRLILIPAVAERLLSLLRVATIIMLILTMLGMRRLRTPSLHGPATLLLSLFLMAPTSRAEFPDHATLTTLRERLLEKDLPALTADIPQATLTITNNLLVIESQIHTATFAAVPLPGRFPTWSPVSVTVDGKPATALRRSDNYLWVALSPGVHAIKTQGLLGDAAQWEWTFLLKPHHVQINAPGWSIGGVDSNGAPDDQVFFSRQQNSVATHDVEVGYDRQNFDTLAVVERQIELGLVWQVRTTVRRLTPLGKAIALRIPLLAGEKMLSSNIPIIAGAADVRFRANDAQITWESELTHSDRIALHSRSDDTWVEQWSLLASPIWNIKLEGVPPLLQEGTPQLTPLWRPWPGESANIAISRLSPVPGPTITIHRVQHDVALGDRQLLSTLNLDLTSSLGEDFLVSLPVNAQINALRISGKSIPPRLENGRLTIPLHPGKQGILIEWRTPQTLTSRSSVDALALPLESANVETSLTVPPNRWVLWASGPQQGPAVRFWSILAVSLLAALFLGRLKFSPLRTFTWVLLGLGLTQISLPEALGVIAWLFLLLVWRRHSSFQKLQPFFYNLVQIFLILATVVALGFLIHAVGAGLLGSPEMFITGNGSTSERLQWYLARSGRELPQPSIYSVSIWWYRLAMLAWALWLAVATLRWLVAGWSAFTTGGVFHSMRRQATPPPLAKSK